MELVVYERITPKLKRKRDPLTFNMVVLASDREVFDFSKMTNFKVGSLQEVKARAVETEKNWKKAQQTIAVYGSRKITLPVTVSSLTVAMLPIRVKLDKFCVDLDEMTTLVKRIK